MCAFFYIMLYCPSPELLILVGNSGHFARGKPDAAELIGPQPALVKELLMFLEFLQNWDRTTFIQLLGYICVNKLRTHKQYIVSLQVPVNWHGIKN